MAHNMWTVDYGEACPVCEVIANAIRKAQVAAHLEDAQAGCWACQSAGIKAGWTEAAFEPDHRGKKIWLHYPKPGTKKPPLLKYQACKRPEVHDALSRLLRADE